MARCDLEDLGSLLGGQRWPLSQQSRCVSERNLDAADRFRC
jgi:hypothetical protein